MTDLVAIDVGGTHARFARASIGADGKVALGAPVTLRTTEHRGLEEAWQTYAAQETQPVPRAAAVAIAGPVNGDVVPMTNSPWVLRISAFKQAVGIDTITVLNDFGAVAHAAARAPDDHFIHIAGPDIALPEAGTVSVIGPGTGLGVAYFQRFEGGYHVQATEGGHVGFCPQDDFDDRLLASLRAQFGRVATERVNAGPGIGPIYAALGGSELADDRAIWKHGIARSDALAAQAVDRFCASLGTAVGDYALAHGASAVVLAGGLGLRLREILPASQFGERFRAKPRYEKMMAGLPVRLIVHPQPGLYGAAAAFALEHG